MQNIINSLHMAVVGCAHRLETMSEVEPSQSTVLMNFLEDLLSLSTQTINEIRKNITEDTASTDLDDEVDVDQLRQHIETLKTKEKVIYDQALKSANQLFDMAKELEIIGNEIERILQRKEDLKNS